MIRAASSCWLEFETRLINWHNGQNPIRKNESTFEAQERLLMTHLALQSFIRTNDTEAIMIYDLRIKVCLKAPFNLRDEYRRDTDVLLKNICSNARKETSELGEHEGTRYTLRSTQTALHT